MNTVHLTDAELALTRNAMKSYLSTFGHDEADVLARVRQVIGKLNAAEQEGEQAGEQEGVHEGVNGQAEAPQDFAV